MASVCKHCVAAGAKEDKVTFNNADDYNLHVTAHHGGIEEGKPGTHHHRPGAEKKAATEKTEHEAPPEEDDGHHGRARKK